MRKKITWSKEKNKLLISERGIDFETISMNIKGGEIIDDIFHPNNEKYENQRIFVVEIDNYIYLVPYVENEKEIFLKTIYPSRKFTKMYLGDNI